MKIAVTHESGLIFQHFGHTKEFKVYEIDDGRIIESKIVETNGQGHGALAEILVKLGVDVLICGGIGGGAQMTLAENDIKFYGGVNGSCDDAVSAFIDGKLGYNPNVKCTHHDHNHTGDHVCTDHGCGGHCH